jgi:hypothetical protein|tara:strand:+ start:50 stop:634 length:585 start_codon:yes stop_codon:yes gene_type:complete
MLRMELQDTTKMFSVHMTHSRKELLDIIRVFKLPITNKNDKNKKQLQDAIIEVVRYLDNVEPEQEYFFINSKEELIDYLERQNPAKTLTIKEKQEVMLTAKKLIAYSRNGYYLIPQGYMDAIEVYKDATYIAKFPEIPSVRKAIELVNKDPKMREKIEMVIPRRVKKQLEKRKAVKQSNIPLYIKRGEFVIEFD